MKLEEKSEEMVTVDAVKQLVIEEVNKSVKLDKKIAIKIIYSEYNKIIIKLDCTNNYAIIKKYE